MNRNLTPSSLSKICLLAGKIYKRLSTKELTKMNWRKTTFSRKNCLEGTVKSNLVFNSQECKYTNVRVFPEDGSLMELFTQCMHL